jgi:thioredoxin 1
MKNLVIFKAHWCQPCKQLAKTVEGLDLGIPVNTIDIDADPTATTEYNIRSVPTLLLIDDMQVIKRKTGNMTAEQLKEFIA